MRRLKAAILAIFLPAVLCAADPSIRWDEEASAVLRAFGFKSIEMVGGAQWGGALNYCDSRDAYARRFTATAQDGQRWKGVVCAGLFFKGWTIRLIEVQP